MIPLTMIKRNDYTIINLFGVIIWLILTIASVLVLIVMLGALFSGSPILIFPVIIIVPFFLSVKAITELIKHALAVIWRSLRRMRYDDPIIHVDTACFQLGDPVNITIDGLPSSAKNIEVELIYRVENYVSIDWIVVERDYVSMFTIQSIASIKHDSTEDTNFTLQLPLIFPASTPLVQSPNWYFLPRNKYQSRTWVAKIKISVSGWINFDEYYRIGLC